MSFKGFLWRAVLTLILLVVLYQVWIFIQICWWIDHNPSRSSFMKSTLAEMQEIDPDAQLKHKWVEYRRISPNLKRALIAAEDTKFIDHEGFDWEGIQKAYEKNLKKGKIVAGGSTISQQLAKNLFLSTQRTPWRKLEEAVITFMLEQLMTKRRILEIYLNIIEWGNGIFGAEAAARHYYGTSASNLSQYQAARLAAMVPRPKFYQKNPNARGLARRTGTIQARMHLVQVP
jgi:monofunctional biosynthetic peptidoglycan transglycosylase